MELTVAVSDQGNTSLIKVVGVLDHATAPYLRQTVFDRLDAGARDIVVEVSGLRLLDAASIAVLLHLDRRLRSLDGRLRLAGSTGTVLVALEIAGAAKALGVYDDLRPAPTGPWVELDLAALRVYHATWPSDVGALLARMAAVPVGDPRRAALRDAVVERCLPAAQRLTLRYGRSGENAGDLRQVAALGLLKAVDGFDPSRGVEFATYAVPTIVGELKRHFRDQGWSIRVPRRLQELSLQVNHARAELTQRLGRSPTTADLATHLKVDEAQVVEAIGVTSAYQPSSLDVPQRSADDQPLVDTIGGDEPAYDLVDYRESIRSLMPGLPEREQRILRLRFFDNLTQLEIAAEVGLSQMHVSRLLRHALTYLRQGLTGTA